MQFGQIKLKTIENLTTWVRQISALSVQWFKSSRQVDLQIRQILTLLTKVISAYFNKWIDVFKTVLQTSTVFILVAVCFESPSFQAHKGELKSKVLIPVELFLLN